MTPFFGKRCFLTWVKKWVLLIVFLKSCVFFWKHYFYSVFSKSPAFQKQKLYDEKNRKFMKNSGLFFEHGKKRCFLGFVFWGFNVIVVCFCVSAIVPKVLKMLVFPSCLGFSGVASSCLFVFGRFGCFCVSCFWFSFWCWFCFCLFALFCFVVGCCCFFFCFLCVFFFVFFFVFFVFVFFWRV